MPKSPVFNQHSNFPLLCHRIRVKTSDMLESPSVFLNKCRILTISSSWLTPFRKHNLTKQNKTKTQVSYDMIKILKRNPNMPFFVSKLKLPIKSRHCHVRPAEFWSPTTPSSRQTEAKELLLFIVTEIWTWKRATTLTNSILLVRLWRHTEMMEIISFHCIHTFCWPHWPCIHALYLCYRLSEFPERVPLSHLCELFQQYLWQTM